MEHSFVERIRELKSQRNAVVLVHNYEPPEIQDIADILGDSLELSRRAADADAEVIVFCGVRFMAETAAILSPDKTVLLPNASAGCPMADMISAAQLQDLRRQHPDALFVTYVNSSAETKAGCDYCCTSGNALRLVQHVAARGKPIVFVPDRNLGTYVSATAGVPMTLWPGYCPIHQQITPEHIRQARQTHPEALVMVHPECPPAVTRLADRVVSTGGMVTWPHEVDAREFIVGTEVGMLYRLQQVHPDRCFYPASDQAVCVDMKKITLAAVANSLETLQPQITVPEPIRSQALLPLQRMLEIA